MAERAPIGAPLHHGSCTTVANARLPLRVVTSNQPTAQTESPAVLIDGRYLLGELLGIGGMARVFAAKHVGSSRSVAVKILARMWADHDDVVERFRNEARAAGSIKHPGVIEVFDVGHLPDGRPYYVMELVRGYSLRQECTWIRRPPMLSKVLGLATSIADSLVAAHAVGVTHRDLKPDNIVVTTGPAGLATKLLDFGIAHEERTQPRRATAPGTVMGTPEYMAPEQAMGAPPAPAVDIYALGVIMYELLAGEVPFRAVCVEPDTMVLVQKVTMSAPSLAQLRPDLPVRLCDLVDECVARRPEHRPASMAEVLTDLGELSAQLHHLG